MWLKDPASLDSFAVDNPIYRAQFNNNDQFLYYWANEQRTKAFQEIENLKTHLKNQKLYGKYRCDIEADRELRLEIEKVSKLSVL